ncbi:MAG: bifunctional riboflavin kinase/FAD synthetase [Anaerolineae bacterium]
MWTARNITDLNLTEPSAITIGAFDGVHLGHKALIERLVLEARLQALQPIVITFDPLPGQILEEDYGLLSSLEERIARIRALGVAGLLILRFDEELMATSAETFVRRMVDHLALRSLWVGPDFTLGRDREGNVEYLQEAGQRFGFTVNVLNQPIMWDGKPVRSSRIRDALKSGDIEEANGCLGYPYHVRGVVVHGEKRGRALGFPTANLESPRGRLLPADGVYICRAHRPSGSYDAISNVGTRPTFNNYPTTIEAYLLDFSGDLYGTTLKLDFLKRLRPELRFSSAEALIAQMRQDEAYARTWLRARAQRAADEGSIGQERSTGKS